MPRLIADAACEAGRRGAGLAVTPELALVGYLPRDLLLSSAFVAQSWEAAAELARELASQPPVLVGLPEPNPPTRDGRSSTRRCCCTRVASASAFARRCCPPTTSSTRTATSSRTTARSCSSSAGAGSASASARTSGTIATSGSAAAITTTRSKSSMRAGRRRDRQPFGVAVLGRQAPAPRRDARQHGAQASRADRVRQPVRRKRRPGVRWPQPGVQRRRGADCAAAARSRPTS